MLHMDYAAARALIAQPFNAVLMIAFLIALVLARAARPAGRHRRLRAHARARARAADRGQVRCVSSAPPRACSPSSALRSEADRMESYKIQEHKYDIVVIGAGGAGLRATFGLAATGLADRVPDQGVSRRARTRSPRKAASRPRSATWARTTGASISTTRSRARTGSATRTRSNTCAARRSRPIIELEHYGVPFSRTEEGKIYQRPFGGMTTHYGKGTAQRTCAAADRTGHAILHTLYQQSLKHDARFFIEYFALDLDLRQRRRLPRRARARHERRHAASVPRARRRARDRRLRQGVFHRDLGAHLHRRRRRT